jgi:hypothetical protein
MKQFAFVIAVLVLALGASTGARADFAVVKFKDTGACRTWYGNAAGKPWGKYQVLWVKTSSSGEAQGKGAWAMKHHWCKAWM